MQSLSQKAVEICTGLYGECACAARGNAPCDSILSMAGRGGSVEHLILREQTRMETARQNARSYKV